MAARNITESTVFLVRDYIKANIATALSGVRTDRADARVSTNPPETYFIFEHADVFRAPAVFIIPRSLNFNLARGSNFINATVDLLVSAIVENKDKESLQIQAYRYQDALHAILNNTEILSTDTQVKLVVKVNAVDFSNVFASKNEDLLWRKEIALQCLVEHWELEN